MVKRTRVWFLAFLLLAMFLAQLFFRSKGVGIANRGISFGFFAGVGVWLIGLFLLVFVFNQKFGFGGWLIATGGAVNLLDRLVYGNVWDYIYWGRLGFWSNGADVMVSIGVICIIILNFKDKILK